MKALKQSLEQFPSELTVLDQVLSWFNQFKHPSIPQKIWLQCQLALAEGFTNAVRHAHKDLKDPVNVEVEVTLLSNYLELRIWDYGPPFDLEGRLKRIEQQADKESGGGRGLAILHKIADQISYTRLDDNRNCLLIVKYY